jgi:DNA invertase Pin-like site-specific DNA recombinase
MGKIDGRTQVLKGMRGHLINTNPNKTWADILASLLNEHGSAAGVARALNIKVQTVRLWLKAETDAGRIVVVEQPPRVYKAAQV